MSHLRRSGTLLDPPNTLSCPFLLLLYAKTCRSTDAQQQPQNRKVNSGTANDLGNAAIAFSVWAVISFYECSNLYQSEPYVVIYSHIAYSYSILMQQG